MIGQRDRGAEPVPHDLPGDRDVLLPEVRRHRLRTPGRITISSPGVDEWLRSDPRGIEHGYTLHAPPPGARGSIRLEVAVNREFDVVVCAADHLAFRAADGVRDTRGDPTGATDPGRPIEIRRRRSRHARGSGAGGSNDTASATSTRRSATGLTNPASVRPWAHALESSRTGRTRVTPRRRVDFQVGQALAYPVPDARPVRLARREAHAPGGGPWSRSRAGRMARGRPVRVDPRSDRCAILPDLLRPAKVRIEERGGAPARQRGRRSAIEPANFQHVDRFPSGSGPRNFGGWRLGAAAAAFERGDRRRSEVDRGGGARFTAAGAGFASVTGRDGGSPWPGRRCP